MRPLALPNPLPLRGRKLDDGFTDLERDAEGRAHFSIESGGKTVETLFGPKYPVATIWLPAGPGAQPREFICFEPLATIISGGNLTHAGKHPGLQPEPAGGTVEEGLFMRASPESKHPSPP